MAPDSTILPYRVLDSDGNGNVFAAAEAIESAVDAGAQIINLSFGMSESSFFLEQAIKRAEVAGVLVVAAAGNRGDQDQHFPAANSKVVAVAAVTEGDELTGFSNRGGWIDLGAPGEDIISAMPDGRYATWSGTSMAAPFAAGAIALAWSMAPELDGKKIVEELQKSARPAQGSDRKRCGKGIINIRAAVARMAARY